MNMLAKSNGSIPMSTELFIKDIAMTSGACIQFRDGWKEGRLKGLSSGVESVSFLPFSVQKTCDKSTYENNENWDQDSFDHIFTFPIVVSIIVALFIIFYGIERTAQGRRVFMRRPMQQRGYAATSHSIQNHPSVPTAREGKSFMLKAFFTVRLYNVYAVAFVLIFSSGVSSKSLPLSPIGHVEGTRPGAPLALLRCALVPSPSTVAPVSYS